MGKAAGWAGWAGLGWEVGVVDVGVGMGVELGVDGLGEG